GYTFLTSDGSRYQRGMAFNPATGHLIIVNRTPTFETLNIIDALTGAEIGQLDQSSPSIGGASGFLYDQIAIADDGSIYVGNLSTSGTLVQYNLYRWDNESAPQRLVYGPANPANTVSGNSRWGDTMALRGTGMATEIILTTQGGSLAAILKPSNPDLTTFQG